MSLPMQAVDRLFLRLGATYGAEWERMWEGQPISAVKTAWAHELAGFATRLSDVAWALENLPERVPNVIAFRNLCRQSPAQPVPRLPEPPADPERVRAELAKLGTLTATPSRSNTEWADIVLARAEAGEKVLPYTLRCARQARKLT